MVEDRVIEEATYHYEIGLRRSDFNIFDEDKKGVGREGYSEFPYVLILIKLWARDWKTKLKRMNQKVDKENGKSTGIINVRYRKVCQVSRY